MKELLALSIENPGGGFTTVKPVGGVPSGGLEIINKVIPNVITILIVVAIILCLIFLIFGGIRWITSRGEKEGVEHARKTITYAIIGLIVVFLSFFILTFLGNLFGVHLLNSSGLNPNTRINSDKIDCGPQGC